MLFKWSQIAQHIKAKSRKKKTEKQQQQQQHGTEHPGNRSKCIPLHLNRDINWKVPNAIDRSDCCCCCDCLFQIVCTWIIRHMQWQRREVERKNMWLLRDKQHYMENRQSSIDLWAFMKYERSLWPIPGNRIDILSSLSEKKQMNNFRTD